MRLLINSKFAARFSGSRNLVPLFCPTTSFSEEHIIIKPVNVGIVMSGAYFNVFSMLSSLFSKSISHLNNLESSANKTFSSVPRIDLHLLVPHPKSSLTSLFPNPFRYTSQCPIVSFRVAVAAQTQGSSCSSASRFIVNPRIICSSASLVLPPSLTTPWCMSGIKSVRRRKRCGFSVPRGSKKLLLLMPSLSNVSTHVKPKKKKGLLQFPCSLVDYVVFSYPTRFLFLLLLPHRLKVVIWPMILPSGDGSHVGNKQPIGGSSCLEKRVTSPRPEGSFAVPTHNPMSTVSASLFIWCVRFSSFLLSFFYENRKPHRGHNCWAGRGSRNDCVTLVPTFHKSRFPYRIRHT